MYRWLPLQEWFEEPSAHVSHIVDVACVGGEMCVKVPAPVRMSLSKPEDLATIESSAALASKNNMVRMIQHDAM